MTRNVEFIKDEVIIKAMNVFWAKGYKATSLKDLVDATGLQKGSIYNSFSSKEDLFLICLDHYGNYSKSLHYKEGDPKKYLINFFSRLVEEGASKKFTKGCMVMNSCLEFADGEAVLLKKSKQLFSSTEKNLENVVTVLLKESSSSADPKKIKIALVAAAFSIREISKFKKDKSLLQAIANNALEYLSLKI